MELGLDHRQVAQCTFALLDPARGDDMAWAPWRDFLQHGLAPKGLEAQEAQLPRLVDLRDLQGTRFEHLPGLVLNKAAAAGVSPCVALLRTAASAKSLSIHLCKVLTPRFPEGQRGIFRYYDPVVFEHLMWMLDERQQGALLGPVDTWWLPRRRMWHAQPNPVWQRDHRVPSFRLPAALWQRVYRIGAIQGVLESDDEWAGAPARWGPRADALLVRARAHGLQSRDDQVAFAAQGLRWHPRLDEHRKLKQVLTDCVDHPGRYPRLTGAWSDADWRAMVEDLDAAAPDQKSRCQPPNLLPQGACR